MVQQSEIAPNPKVSDRVYAKVLNRSFQLFGRSVPRLIDSAPIESALRNPAGTPKRGGVTQSAARRLSDPEFSGSAVFGLPTDLEARDAQQLVRVFDL